MVDVYLYVMDTLADWEIGLLMPELNTGRFFKKDAVRPVIHHAGASYEPVTTMGGFRIEPDCTVEDIEASEDAVLILPGSDRWMEPENRVAISKAREVLSAGGTVCAICGATVALAYAGMLDDAAHTSNGAGFLEAVCPVYKGGARYIDAPAASDSGLITAASTGSIEWSRLILERLDVMTPSALDAWYRYFSTGDAGAYFALANETRR